MTTLPFHPDDLPGTTPEQAAHQSGRGTPRLRIPHRDQVEMSWASLDERLDPDSQVRVVWSLVCRLDLDAWLKDIKAIERHAGRDATDPRLLVALWVFATLKGIGSARELERLCENHLAYQWLCGGVSVNYHMLAAFRSRGGDKWDELLTQIVATLMDAGLVTMDRVAQDGMRVRGDAGQSSFRTAGRLAELLEEAKLQVKTLKDLAETNPDELTRRQRAARERAARERQERIENAQRECDELRQKKAERDKGRKEKSSEARALNHGPRGAHHQIQRRRLPPRIQRPVRHRHGDRSDRGRRCDQRRHRQRTNGADARPVADALREDSRGDARGWWLCISGFDRFDRGAGLHGLRSGEGRGQAEEGGQRPVRAKPHDTDHTAAWRKRMGEEASKVLYRLRAQTAEWVNAMSRNRGLRQMPVRRSEKV